MLHTRWSAEAWSQARVEFKRALSLRSETQRVGDSQRCRPSASSRGYGEAWRKIRDRILKRDGGFCVPCKDEGRMTPATMVDHIKPKHLSGGDDANLRAICRRCHDRKTGAEGRHARSSSTPPTS
jgi:5-methylcytosine-specific restriction protein A